MNSLEKLHEMIEESEKKLGLSKRGVIAIDIENLPIEKVVLLGKYIDEGLLTLIK